MMVSVNRTAGIPLDDEWRLNIRGTAITIRRIFDPSKDAAFGGSAFPHTFISTSSPYQADCFKHDESARPMFSETKKTSTSDISGNMGRERTSAAARSDTGRCPLQNPKCEYIG